MDTNDRRTILIVDTTKEGSKPFIDMFSEENDIRVVSTIAEAFATLRRLASVSIILINSEAYQFIRQLNETKEFSSIPVVIYMKKESREIQLTALTLGVADIFVCPYNPQLIKTRVKNIMNKYEQKKQAIRNEFLENQLHQIEIDTKTGIWTKAAFCSKASALIKSDTSKQYAIVRWDIDHFKVFNDVFGVAEGDKLLAKIGQAYRESNLDSLYAHGEADHFLECIELTNLRKINLVKSISTFLNSFKFNFDLVPRIGVYIVDDPTLDVSLMCDRALLALRSIKNDYSVHIAYYNESMRSALLEEQEIISEMESALEQGQFVVYLQPQFNYDTKTIHGAEALVRWNHPTKGLISPNKFIPIFERNGFISKMDEYIWEEVCKLQRKWLDENISVVPVSVNISRRDIYNFSICETINTLVKKYNLPTSLLRLEITESAYMDNATQLIRTVEALQSYGFAVEMDDFGSGYSSLNTLKEVPVNMLKLDLKFLHKIMDDKRSGTILTSVIRMAQRMKLPVIAEGVETKSQADYLISVGCRYMQGYFFAKPMPVSDYEKMLKEQPQVEASIRNLSNDIEGAENFLTPSVQSTLLFNSFLGGAAILEFDGNHAEVLRLNDKFFEAIGIKRSSLGTEPLVLTQLFDEGNKAIIISAIKKAISTNQESDCEVQTYSPDDLSLIWLQLRMRFLARSEMRHIIYLSVENTTKKKELAEQNARLSKKLTSIMENFSVGILDFEIRGSNIIITYFNNSVLSISKYTAEEYRRNFVNNPFSIIHPDDIASIKHKISDVVSGKTDINEADFRHKCADGEWRWVHFIGRIVNENEDTKYFSAILTDIDDKVKNAKIAEIQARQLEYQRISLQTLFDTIPCGIMQFAINPQGDKEMSLLSFNDTAWKLLGYKDKVNFVEQFRDRKNRRYTDLDDSAKLAKAIIAFKNDSAKTLISGDYRLFRVNGGICWLNFQISKGFLDSNSEVIQIVYTDITQTKQQDTQILSNALFAMFDEVFEIDVHQDIAFKRSSIINNDKTVGALIPFSRSINKLCNEYLHPDDRDFVKDIYFSIGKRNDNKKTRSAEFRYIDKYTKDIRWMSVTIINVSDFIYLSCNKDITDEKNVNKLVDENRELLILMKERHKTEEINRIFIENTNSSLVEYNPNSDVLTIQHKGDNNKLLMERIPAFLSTLPQNNNISIEDRPKIEQILRKQLCDAGNSIYEFSGRLLGNSFKKIRMHTTSITDEMNNVLRLVGCSSIVSDREGNSELTARLRQLTGFDFSEIPYHHDIVDHTLSLLHRAPNTNAAVQSILAYVGSNFNVSRVYIFEETENKQICSKTFEWCNEGITSQIDKLKNFEFFSDMRNDYLQLFNQGKGVIACSNIKELPEFFYNTFVVQDIKSILQFAILKNGEHHWFIGFDECTKNRSWTSMEISTLQIVAQIIGSFLYAKQSQLNLSFAKEAFEYIDKMPAYYYVVDPDTYTVLYANEKMTATFGESVGTPCYKAFANGSPCKNCPVKLFSELGVPAPVKVILNGSNPCFFTGVSNLWQGKKAFILSGTDAASFTQDPEKTRLLQYRSTITNYSNVLSTIFDEIIEMDYDNDYFAPLIMSPKRELITLKTNSIVELLGIWVDKRIFAEDVSAFRKFFSYENIMKQNENNAVQVLDYRIKVKDGSKHIRRATLVRIWKNKYLCCILDVSDRERIPLLENELIAMTKQVAVADRYRIVVEQSETAVVDMDYRTETFFSNDAYLKYAASRFNQDFMFRNENDIRLIFKDDKPIYKEFSKSIARGDNHVESVLRVMMTDGSFRWTRITADFIRDKNGSILRVIGTFTDLDELINSKESVAQLNKRIQSIMQSIPTGILICEVGEHILPLYLSDRACEMFGFTPEEYDLRIINKEPLNFIPNIPGIIKKLESGKRFSSQPIYARRKDGSQFWLRFYCNVEKKTDNGYLCYAVLADISNEIKKQTELVQLQEKYYALLRSSGSVSFEYLPQDDTFSYTFQKTDNGEAYTKILANYLSEHDKLSAIAEEDRLGFVETMLEASRKPMTGTCDFKSDFGNGMRWYRAKFLSLVDENNHVFSVFGNFDDIDNFVKEQEHLREVAMLDKQTGTYNKTYAVSAIQSALLDKPTDRTDALFFLDIDNFKSINDTYGHPEADVALKTLGKIVTDNIGDNGIAARYGGDEFIIYFTNAESKEKMEEKAQKIIWEINQIEINGEKPVGISIGIALIRETGLTYDDILTCSDKALYIAKGLGKNQFSSMFCNKSMYGKRGTHKK